jgi:hypothetical protein
MESLSPDWEGTYYLPLVMEWMKGGEYRYVAVDEEVSLLDC